jgi:uncharacterized membrane protein YfcA
MAMEPHALTIALLSLASLVAGFIDSVAGGGGLITLPALLFAGVGPQYALGTNKMSGCLGTAVAVVNFARKNMVYWPLIGLGIGFTFLGAALGSRVILSVDESVVGKIVVLLLPFAAIGLLSKRMKGTHAKKVHTLKPVAAKAILICFSIGFYDGFFGPGTGTFLALAFCYFLHFSLMEATANAKVFNLASNLASLCVFLFNQKVLFAVAIPMALANMSGNYIGSHMAMKKGDGFIRYALLVSLVILLGSMIWKFYNR